MKISCPSCGSEDISAETNNGTVSGEAWTCLMCPAIICVDCYHEHTRARHSESLKEIRKKKKKR